VIITNVMVTNVCSGSGSGIEEMMMSKSEVSEMERAQLGNPSTRRISGSADHTGVLTVGRQKLPRLAYALDRSLRLLHATRSAMV
jgi:hypothetical protein